MSVIRGRFRGGKIDLDTPPDWPEGAEVEVHLAEGSIGISEEEQGDDPESIARWLAWMETVQPFLSPVDEARWKAARQAQKEYNISKCHERAEKLRKLFG